jgi:hypothetical protein
MDEDSLPTDSGSRVCGIAIGRTCRALTSESRYILHQCSMRLDRYHRVFFFESLSTHYIRIEIPPLRKINVGRSHSEIEIYVSFYFC